MYFRIFLSVHPMLSEYLTVFEVYFYSSFAKQNRTIIAVLRVVEWITFVIHDTL